MMTWNKSDLVKTVCVDIILHTTTTSPNQSAKLLLRLHGNHHNCTEMRAKGVTSPTLDHKYSNINKYSNTQKLFVNS